MRAPRAKRARALGYLLKDRVADVERVRERGPAHRGGGSALDPAVVAQLLGRRPRDDPIDELTAARTRGARADGRRPLEPGDRRRDVRARREVEKHVTNVFEKLDLPASPDDHRRVLAVLALLRT